MMKMIIGLGNPGKKYEGTRHNIGFMQIDLLSKAWNIPINKKEHNALTGTGFFRDDKVLLVKPQTFMNNSGEAVWQLLSYYSDQLENFLVIYDDMDLSNGILRFKQKGSSGGHNGIKSIIHHLNSKEFDRLKIGIGKKENVISHVLSTFSNQEKKEINDAVIMGVQACEDWLLNDILYVMNKYN